MNKKVYFAASIRGGRDDADLYKQLIEHIQTKAIVLTEHIGDAALTVEGQNNTTDQEIHDKDIAWVMDADLLIAEVTNPSLGVGYEIGRAVENKIPVFALYREQDGKKLSAMIRGSQDVKVYDYADFEEAKSCIDNIFENL